MPLNTSWKKNNDHNSSATDLQDVFRNKQSVHKIGMVWYGTESGCCGEIFMAVAINSEKRIFKCFVSVNMIADSCKPLQPGHLSCVPSD